MISCKADTAFDYSRGRRRVFILSVLQKSQPLAHPTLLPSSTFFYHSRFPCADIRSAVLTGVEVARCLGPSMVIEERHQESVRMSFFVLMKVYGSWLHTLPIVEDSKALIILNVDVASVHVR